MKERLSHMLARMDDMESGLAGCGILGRIDARAKLLTAAVFIAVVLSVPIDRLSELMLYFLFPLVISAMGGANYVRVAMQSAIVLPLALLVGIGNVIYCNEPAMTVGSTVISRGWVELASIAVRALLSMQTVILLIRSTGFYRMCRAVQRSGLPVLLSAQLLLAYRYAYVLTEEALAMSRARAARGFGRRNYPLGLWGALVGELLLRSMGRSRSIAGAMSARGFTGRIPEGLSEGGAWHVRDTVFCVVWIASFVAARACFPVEKLSSILQ